MRFVDEAKIFLKAGKGGDGIVSFRREKFVPKGGPDGGDGGDGGSIYFVGDIHLATLYDFRYRTHYKAGRGKPGGPNNKKGASGDDLYIKVPLGTMIFEGETLIADIVEPDKPVLICKGGRGGYGNSHFKSATNQAPKVATPGQDGEEKEVKLVLKLIADVSLVGAPNAGKSTFINSITNASFKVAPYPFTTLHPNLGVCRHKGYEFVIADVPGLIDGASAGKGLGINFLKHIERTKIILYFISIEEAPAILEGFLKLEKELKTFNPELITRTSAIVITKTDIIGDDEEFLDEIKKELTSLNRDIFTISSFSGYGITKLLDFLIKNLGNEKERLPI